MSELRFNPFRGDWTITATHRQDRTFFPPDDYCPLCPTRPDGFPTEIPTATYDIAVFENKFPSLSPHPPEPPVEGSALMPVRPSAGVCEVICYSEDHHATLAELPLRQVQKLVRVWQDRTRELSQRPEVKCVFIFENKGREIGVTLSHPHGQIYAYPFVPERYAADLERERRHLEATGNHLTADWLAEELADGRRSIDRHGPWISLVPFFARRPYEAWIVPNRHLDSLLTADDRELDDLAAAVQSLVQRFDRLFGFSMPYVMAVFQAPVAPGYEYAWMRLEFYPPYRTADKLKYIAGSEAGMDVWINDTLPEDSAARLRSC